MSLPGLGDGLCEMLASAMNSLDLSGSLRGPQVNSRAASPSSPSSIQTSATDGPTQSSSPITDLTWSADSKQVEARDLDAVKYSAQPQYATSSDIKKRSEAVDLHRLYPSLGFGLSTTADLHSPSQDGVYPTSCSVSAPEPIARLPPKDTRAVSEYPRSADARSLTSFKDDATKAGDTAPSQPLSLVSALQGFQQSMPRNPTPVQCMRHAFLSKLSKYDGLGNRANVHVFVDISNIYISFCNAYKASQNIPINRRIIVPSFQFKVFTSILERGRDVTKKILAGSTSRGCDEDPRTYWPRHFLEAESIGYQMNIFGRILKRKAFPTKSRRRCKNSPRSPYQFDMAATSGDDLSEDGLAASYEIRNGEQGVDENIHLNMMDSLFECQSNPGTTVLATGDAARAEFSSGFLTYATRLLDAGWNVELVAWRDTLSSSWVDHDFTEKYRGRFNIIFLDEFLEELQTNFID
ncbi:hypothetical protein GGR52DRAFT_575145 [Hypoxylon sp. FL1284]|nr:hypothetical protein GGR52DRAFT_575145 [Hypoxylon sp. FL1284]